MATAFSGDGKESAKTITQRVMDKDGLDVILIGNPGAGKSTILSSLSGKHFECGVSFGKGLTTQFQMENDGNNRNIRWFDTAGLGDACVIQAEMAAKSIQDAIDFAMKEKRGTTCFKFHPQDVRKSGFYLFYLNVLYENCIFMHARWWKS